jgi:precorrin-6B methylase 2
MDLIQLLEENMHLTWYKENYVGTDKGGYPGEHDFIKGFYNEEFKKYQDKEIDLLEIGIYGGASMALWSLYFPKAKIIGLDINDEKIADKYRNIDRVRIGIADAYHPEVANQMGDFDIVIDDGPHTIETLIKCIELYLPKLREGGVMVLEDVQDTSWFPLLLEATPEEYKDKTKCIDLRENLGRYDDLLFVIRK